MLTQSTMQFQQAIQHSDPHPQYPQPPAPPQKLSLEDTLQKFMHSTKQFQQDTQSSLQANT